MLPEGHIKRPKSNVIERIKGGRLEPFFYVCVLHANRQKMAVRTLQNCLLSNFSMQPSRATSCNKHKPCEVAVSHLFYWAVTYVHQDTQRPDSQRWQQMAWPKQTRNIHKRKTFTVACQSITQPEFGRVHVAFDTYAS